MSLRVLDNSTGEMFSITSIHSIPSNTSWLNENVFMLNTMIHPSVSKLVSQSNYDLAKMTQVFLEKENGNFNIVYKSV
jgi:hypothetical protein